jgi:imidazolonepropionase-like amidohydrolase
MSQPVVFQNALMIDCTGAPPQPVPSLIVAEGVIQEIGGPAAKLPKGAQVIDLKGRCLMPGLIDAHIHAGNVELRTPLTAQLPPAVYVLKACRNLETDLELGYTTVRDAAGLDPSFRAAIEQGLVQGPRLLLSITPLSQSGGNTAARGFGADVPQPRNPLGIYPEICDGPEQVRTAARRALGRGADQVKVCADGEVLASQAADRAVPGQWKFSVEELRAAVEVAQAAGTYVMAHVYGPRAIRNCVEAGVRSIEHGNLLDEETARLMAERGAYFVPTLTVYDLLVQHGREWGLDDYSLAKLALVGKQGRRALELAHRAGVKIGSGADIVGPAQSLKGRELPIKAEVLGPMGAILATTKTNAELLNLSDRLGTVEPGKWADLIVVKGNPLQDISLFEDGRKNVLLVMKEGRIMKDVLG